jgi:hypothetical protein
MAAALTVAKAVGIDTTVPTVGGESYLFEKTSTKLSLLSGADDLTDIRTSIKDDQLPTTLADESYLDDNNDEFDYTQTLDLTATTLMLSHFQDKDYENKEPTLGMYVAKGDTVLDYTLEFKSTGPECGADIETTTITMLGKEYYIIDDVTDDCDVISLLDTGDSHSILEGETSTVGGKSVAISFVNEDEVVLSIDGKETNSLEEGETYKLSDGTYVGVKDIRYSPKEAGKSSVVVSLGTGRIDLDDTAGTVEINDEEVDGLTVDIDTDGATLSGFVFTWAMDEEGFITPDSSITLPGLGGISFMTTGMVFPTGETITPEASGTDAFVLNVPIKDGDAEIPLLYDGDAADGIWDFIGSAEDELLITDDDSDGTIAIDIDSDDNYFVASYFEDEEAESYYIEPVIDEVDGTDVVSLKNILTGKYLCEDVEASDSCEFGNVEIDVDSVSDAAQTAELTVTDVLSMTFNVLYSEEGATIYLPNEDAGETGYVNLSVDTDWDLVIDEASEEGTLGGGEEITLTLGFNTEDEASVTAVDETVLSGADMLETGTDHLYVGYVASDLASRIELDTDPDQDTVEVTYYGEQVYGNVYITGTGATTGSTSWTAVKDSETSAYTSKNVIAIGGTAVNKVARKMLGLDEATPVYGYEDAWSTATGVDMVGKGILWMKTSPYTTGKYALLVAGYEGADTEKTANFLTLKGTTLAKEKAVIDTVNNVEATA